MTGLIEAALERVVLVARPTARHDRYLFFPLLAPAVLLAAGNDAFGFDAAGYLDAFVYLGYFWHYPEHLWVFDDNSNYKISRLPWILPGYVLHTVAGPIIASYVLAYLSLALGAVALYLLVRDCFDDRDSAAVVSVAWGCCTWAHGNGGWNYHVLAAIGFYLMACWLVVRTAQSGSRRAAAMAGVCLAAAIHTHLFLVTFAPLVAALYLAAVPHEGRRRFSQSVNTVCWATVGGLVLTIALMGINRGTGGAWLFFMPQIEQAIKLTQPDYDVWWRGDVSQWLPAARYLTIPLAILVAGLAVLLRGRHDRNRRLSLTLVALGWAALGIMCYFQFVRRQTTFDYSYMAFVLYPHAFACLGAVLSDARQGARHAGWVAGLASAAILVTLLVLLPRPLPEVMDGMSRSLGLARFTAIVPPLVASLIGVLAMQVTRGSGRVVVFALWFSVVNAWIAPLPAAYGLGTSSYQQSMLRIFREADRFTTAIDPTLIGIKYWMSDEPLATGSGEIRLQHVFDSFVATRAWYTNLLGRQTPSPPIEKLTLGDLDRGACIGIVSSLHSQPTLQREMEAHYARLGQPLGAVTVQRFEDANLSFALAVLKPLSSADDGGPPCAR